MPRIGLYYPFMHFRDQAWLKLSALYWPKMARIVPRGYELRDSPTVRRLKDELGFVQELDPTPAAWRIAPLFVELLQQHGPALRKRYDPQLLLREESDSPEPQPARSRRPARPSRPAVQPEDAAFQRQQVYNVGVFMTGGTIVSADSIRFGIGTVSADPARVPRGLAHVAVGKMDPALVDAMLGSGLVIRSPVASRGTLWLSMHPRLAAIYLTALAENLAAANQLEPLTDRAIHHVAVSGWTLPRLAQALLEKTRLVGPSPSTMEIPDRLGMLAIRSVVPRDLDLIPVEKIIELRTRFGDELSLFRSHLDGLAADLEALRTVDDPTALQAHLEAVYQDTLRKDLDRLGKDLNAIGMDTATALLNVRLALPVAATSLAELAHAPLPVDPVVAAGGAIAFGFADALRAKRRQAQELLGSSPAAYLLRVSEQLTPASLISNVQRRVRRFLTGA